MNLKLINRSLAFVREGGGRNVNNFRVTLVLSTTGDGKIPSCSLCRFGQNTCYKSQNAPRQGLIKDVFVPIEKKSEVWCSSRLVHAPVHFIFTPIDLFRAHFPVHLQGGLIPRHYVGPRGGLTIGHQQKQWFFKEGSTQNRWLLMAGFSKGGSTWNRWVLVGFEVCFIASKN